MSENLFLTIGMIVFVIIFLYISPRGRSKKLDFMYPKAFRMAQEVFREKVVYRLGALKNMLLPDSLKEIGIITWIQKYNIRFLRRLLIG